MNNKQTCSIGGGNSRSICADVLKGIGIILVVLGHTTQNHYLSSWIYAFHMPLFFVLSGVFFKPSIPSIRKYAKRLLIPYVVFAVLSFVYWRFLEMRFRPLPEGFDVNMHALDVLWQRNHFRFNVPLWFLPCMFFVQSIGCILFTWIKKPVAIVCVTILCFLVACINPFKIESMWLSETLYAFPFFGLGYCLGKDRFIDAENRLSNVKWYYAVYAMLPLVGLCFVNVRNDMMMSSYAFGYGMYFTIAVSAIVCCFVLASIIRKRNWLIWLGVNSLAIMCMHEPLKRILIVIVSKMVHMPTEMARESVIFSVVVSVVIIAMLIPACKVINKKFKWVLGR